MGLIKRTISNLNLIKDIPVAMRMALTESHRNNKKMVVELQRQTEILSKKDIGSWRAAWQNAISATNPNRCPLLDIYTDVAVDLHVTGCISQRKGMTVKSRFKLVDKKGKESEHTEILRSEWFSDFMDLALDSRFYGHSLIELGNISNVGGIMRFDGVSLVPRKHVRPEFGVIVRSIYDDNGKGINYRTGDIANWCIEVGKPYDLGLFLKCAPAALSKKNMLAFWDGFGEIFGMPIRIAKTTSNDENERSRVEHMLAKMSAAFWGVFQEGTEIEIKESSRGDAYNVYDKRIDKANAEISKGILNQTMTIDSGSSLSQSEVHLEVFQNVIEQDRQLIANIVNDKLLPIMLKHKFPVENLRFEWDETEEYTPQDMRTVERMLVNAGYEIDPQYFIDKYGIPIIGKRKDKTSSADLFKQLTAGDSDFFA